MTRRSKLLGGGLVALLLLVAFGRSAIGQGTLTTLFDIIQGYPQRSKPTKNYDSRTAAIPARFSPFGEVYVQNPVPTKHLLADEGSYYVAGTTTSTSIGSSITMGTMGTSVSFSATKAALVLKNNDQPGPNSKRIYLDYVKFFNWTTAPTSAVSVNMAVEVDNVNRAPTAGNGTLTIVNANMDDATGSIANAFGFNIATTSMMTVPSAGAAARQVTQCMLKSQIPVVRDSLEAYFGAVEGAGGTMGTTGGRFVTNCAPVIIGPQQFVLIHVWAPSAAADPNTEYEMAWWER